MDSLQLAQQDLQSNDPFTRQRAEEFLALFGEDTSSSTPEPEEPDSLELYRRDLESGDKDKIARAMAFQAHINEQKGRSDLGRHAARTVKNVATGLLSPTDIPGMIYEFSTGKEGIKPAHYLNKKIDEWSDNYTVPTSKTEKVTDAITSAVAGIPTGSLAFKGIVAAGKGISKGIIGAAKSAKIPGTSALRGSSQTAPRIESLGQRLTSNPASLVKDISKKDVIGAALGYGGAQAYLNEHPDDPYYVSEIMKYATPYGVSKAPKLAGKAAKGLANTVKPLLRERINVPAAHAFLDAGIPVGLADVSKNLLIQQLKDQLPKKVGAQKIMRNYREGQISAINKNLGPVAERLSEDAAASLAVKGMEKYKTKKQDIFNRLYKETEADLKALPSSEVNLKGTGEWFDSLTPSERKLMMSGKTGSKAKPYVEELFKLESGDIPGAAAELNYSRPLKELLSNRAAAEAASNALDVHNAQGILRSIGSKIKDTPLKEARDAELAHLYGVLKGDIESSIVPKLSAEALKRRSHVASKYSEFASIHKDDINDLLSKANKVKGKHTSRGAIPEIEKELISDLKEGGDQFSKVRTLLSKPERRELSQAVLNKLGQRQGQFVPYVMHTGFEKLKPSVQKQILGSLGKTERKTIKDTLKAIAQSKEVQKQANFSQSGHHLGAYHDITDFASAATETAKNFGTSKGAMSGLTNILGRFGANQLAAKGLTNEALIRWLVDRELISPERYTRMIPASLPYALTSSYRGRSGESEGE